MFSLGSLGAPDRPGEGRVAVRYCFTGRAGGSSQPPYDSLNLSFDVGDDVARVVANRSRLLERVGLTDVRWQHAEHGARIAVVAEDSEPLGRSDGLATHRAGVGLAALSADCALIVLGDPAAGVVGVAHCGRPGLVAGVVGQAVRTLRELGGEQLLAAVGPTVCGDCYELPLAMAEEVLEAVPAARARPGHVDIRAGVVAQLHAAGVEVQHLAGGCTREDTDSFSYRRDGTTGRMAALAWLAPATEGGVGA